MSLRSVSADDTNTARMNDGDSIASSDGSSISDDETNLANDAEASDANAEVTVLNNPVAFALAQSPPTYQLAALPLGSPENPIEIEDEDVANQLRINEEVNDYEQLNSPRWEIL
ncbi:uncharacterized protein PGTG_18643 [Puccinia graminis f. sp. tritici CRL 75-36-700-3]|uniref:Uncharacterized protein n=1 Tax=Puccinia graminis f. sp. tritici (strain CRL 75-36-700-3 / race SCCL) TaxID=418459 RepID=E3L884_PUCGT|nr:uncharacterized protein PGTG_18643 [Puccinia graminis f. sp. tritici CRL 75-36-700-3]EFP92759.2 hypothetical protein PGTG_18643 [Puccinia graminis f. sp. tritici CRL 75-36-700-3]